MNEVRTSCSVKTTAAVLVSQAEAIGRSLTNVAAADSNGYLMLGQFATASRYIAIHQVSLLSHAATIARRLRIDVHNDDDDNNDNDNA